MHRAAVEHPRDGNYPPPLPSTRPITFPPHEAHNVTVNHRRRVLWSTSGHPGSWNDKTLAPRDEFIQQLRKDQDLDNQTFFF
jgi:hypothetical protein